LPLATLWIVAHYNGIKEFVGYVLPENRVAIRWLRNTGAEIIGWIEELPPRVRFILTKGKLREAKENS